MSVLAWNSTLDAVSSMNASSREACAWASSCSRMPRSKARSPIWSVARPCDDERAVRRVGDVAAGQRDRAAQGVGLGGADPDRLHRVTGDELGHGAVGDAAGPGR